MIDIDKVITNATNKYYDAWMTNVDEDGTITREIEGYVICYLSKKDNNHRGYLEDKPYNGEFTKGDLGYKLSDAMCIPDLLTLVTFAKKYKEALEAFSANMPDMDDMLNTEPYIFRVEIRNDKHYTSFVVRTFCKLSKLFN
jgi:hypothetical protein